MDKHLKSCTKRELTTAQLNSTQDAEIMVERVSSMEENLTFLRKSLNEEIQMRHDMIVELGHLKKRNQVIVTFWPLSFIHACFLPHLYFFLHSHQITDEWTSKVSEVLNLLQKRIEEEKECRQLEIKDFHGVIDSLLKQFQVGQSILTR